MTQEEKVVSERTLGVIWNAYYWAAFVLCWSILPFMLSYVRAGDFNI